MECRNLYGDLRKVVEELVRGRESANELKDLLMKSSGAPDLVLVEKILNSFANSIARLSSGRDHSDEVSQNLRIKPEDSGDSIKSSVKKDGRGCYKRRKYSESWSRETPTLSDDGYAWRKYGQKDILKAKHPRSYFRCTHKPDQGCQATKQVQKIEDDPPKYRITYYGHHTCSNLLKSSQLMLDSTSQEDSVLLNFETGASPAPTFAATAAVIKPESPFISSLSSVKREYKDDVQSEHTHHQSSSTTTSDYLVSPDITSGGGMMGLPDYGDVFSGVVDDVLHQFEF
ncbi:hypothetical protein SLE2022_341940 [Rubroshorea leprosula]